MSEEKQKENTENSEQVSRRSFIEKSAIGLGAIALAASGTDVMGQTRVPFEPKTDKANPNGKFAGKVVLITGATSGIGEGTAYAFAREGARVFFCGRRENLGKQVEAKIKNFGGDGTYMRADVRVEQDVKSLVDACLAKYGRLDAAFNNAGIVNPNVVNLHEQTAADFQDTFNTNVAGMFYSMKYEIPVMMRQGGGYIVNVASVSAHKGFTGRAPYSSSKHAVVGLTRVAALEYAKNNIRITSISPGGVDTPMLRQVMAKQGRPFEDAGRGIAIGRVNTVEEMAQAVMFLSSEEASAFHGSIVDVTSGGLD